MRASHLSLAAPAPTNDAYGTLRLNTPKRLARGPSRVKRLGHCVLHVMHFRESEAWYKARFGLLT